MSSIAGNTQLPAQHTASTLSTTGNAIIAQIQAVILGIVRQQMKEAGGSSVPARESLHRHNRASRFCQGRSTRSGRLFLGPERVSIQGRDVDEGYRRMKHPQVSCGVAREVDIKHCFTLTAHVVATTNTASSRRALRCLTSCNTNAVTHETKRARANHVHNANPHISIIRRFRIAVKYPDYREYKQH